jgi:hypothetical protein
MTRRLSLAEPRVFQHKTDNMRPAHVNTTQVILFFLGSIILFAFGAFSLQKFAIQPFGMEEFPINYIAAKNWVGENRSPYDSANAVQIPTFWENDGSVEPREDITYFRYPLLTTLILLPFTLLPAGIAKAAWIVFSIVSLVIGCILLIAYKGRHFEVKTLIVLAIFCGLNLYSLIAVITGSLLPVLFLIIILILFLIKDHHDVMAGFLATCAMIVFQFGVLVVIYLNIWAIKTKRKSFIRSFWAGLLFETAISVILSPMWLRGWIASILQDLTDLGRYASLLSHLTGIRYPDNLWLNLILHLVMLLILLTSVSSFKVKDEEGFAWIISMIMLVTSMVAFPIMPGVQLFCLPALIMVVSTWMMRWERHGKTFFWTAMVALFIIPWIFTLFSGLEVIYYLQGLLYALIAIVGLWWIRWWMIRPRY